MIDLRVKNSLIGCVKNTAKENGKKTSLHQDISCNIFQIKKSHCLILKLKENLYFLIFITCKEMLLNSLSEVNLELDMILISNSLYLVAQITTFKASSQWLILMNLWMIKLIMQHGILKFTIRQVMIRKKLLRKCVVLIII